ncbi:MAG: hypothetical protein KDD62_02250, partial [Bdellovibrionales bacterium]|nr:hypothetical protein [Bdellovibrionales bacterium]
MPKANTILEIDPYTYSNEFLTSLYRDLLFPRLIEEKMLLLLRKGKISKWFSGIGQEAISVGATRALQSDEFIFPMHRNLGVFTTREVPLNRLFHQFQGTRNGFTNGRDRSFHFGTLSHHLVGMISHLGPQLALAGGIALAHQLRAEQKVSLAFSGEGGTSEGDFHEALNIAAVWKLPVIFLIENNGYGLSTPVSEQYACEQLSERAQGYGMLGETIDGNDVLQVYHCIQTHAERMRKDPYPVLIECMTFRMRGHEEASGTAYVPEELFTQWQEKDPIARFETSLLERNILSQELIAQIRDELTEQIDGAIEEVYEQEHEFTCSADEEISAVFAPVTTQASEPKEETKEARFVDAVSDGLYQSLKRYPELLILGQDVGTYGGVFKITKDFTEIFGTDRIRNTPLCESGVLGNALGLSIAGMKAVVEMQFSDFVSCGMTQIINYFAKLYYRWGQPADVVVRLPCGAGVGAGPFHSQTMEAWFTHTAGLKVVYPAFPIDAKRLLIRAIADPNPV